jgi:hypothetical protein
MISTKNLEARTAQGTGLSMMKTQQELTNLKNQIGNLDKVSDVQSYYYSLQRNIENFERQLEKQMDGYTPNTAFPNKSNFFIKPHPDFPSLQTVEENRKRDTSTRYPIKPKLTKTIAHQTNTAH